MSTKRKKYLLCKYVSALVAFALAFSACDRMEDDLVVSDEVKLTASLSPVLSSVYTKAEIKSDHNEDLRIGLAKLSDNVVLPATMYKPTAEDLGLRKIKFDDFQSFPDASTPISYVGWYPLDGEDGGSYTAASGGAPAKVSFTIPEDASTDILYSDVATGTRLSGFNTMTFRHALVKYSILVYAMETDDAEVSVADEWGTVNSVTLESMPSSCVLTLPSDAESLPQVSFEDGPGGSGNLTIDDKELTIPENFSNAAMYGYFLAPAPNDNILSLVVGTEKGGTTRQTLSLATDFQIGKHYQIYLRFTTHGVINAEIVVGEWEDVKDPIDVDESTGIIYNLSEAQTANTYIVSSAYSYCFDATVRGNGYTGVVGIPGALDAGHSIYQVEGAVSAEVVWTDLVGASNSELDPKDDPENLDKYFQLSPTLVEGKVCFTIPQSESGMTRALPKEGNVVLGVRDNQKQLLWTWHIWLTDRPQEQGYKNGFTVQDRDLGAVAYDAEDPDPDKRSGITGLFYQWGRPTPLPLGDKSVYRPVYNKETGEWERNELVHIEPSDDELPIVGRVAEPTTFFNARATAKEGTLTKHLWGWRTESDEYSKTIYDPCPVGYRVPSIKLWRDLVIYGDATTVKVDGKDIAAKFEVEANHAVVYYPMTGYYTSYNYVVDEYRGAYMWSATFYVDEKDVAKDHPYALDFAYEDESDTEINDMEVKDEFSNYALPVRCISRMSKAHVTDLSDYQTANSYLVHKGGYYKFKATVRGNGVGQIVSPGSSSTIVLTEQLQSVDIKNQLVKVEPLWWHSLSDSAPSNDILNAHKHFSLQNDGKPDADGYVTFNVGTFYEGNLILAGRDAKGDIIWSWHIWFTDPVTMVRSNSYEIMDRNLGAIHSPTLSDNPLVVNETTYGLYYQWGRKDPFLDVNKGVYKYDASNRTYSYTTSAFNTESETVNKTVANSILHPMTFHLASDWNEYGVFSPSDNSIMTYLNITTDDNKVENQCFSSMVHPEYRSSIWGYSSMKGEYGVTSTKTMYDPCPPGYSVTYYLVWTNTERDTSGSEYYYSELDGGFMSHYLRTSTGGIFINDSTTDWNGRNDRFESTWFPFAGYLRGSDYELKEVGSMGVFHTSTPAGNGSRNLMYNSTQSGQGIIGSSIGLPSTFAYPVRCQKE